MATDGNGKVQSPNVVEGKKRKRIKEKDEVSDIELASLGEGLVAPLEISKLKKKTKSSVESKNFGPESKALSNKANGNNHPKLCYSRLISDLEDSNSESEVGDDGRRISDKMDAAKRGTSKVPSLPPPCPKSPPEYPDLYGKRRELAKVQMLEREIDFLEGASESVQAVGFSFMTAEEVRRHSVKQITNPNLLDVLEEAATWRENLDQLYKSSSQSFRVVVHGSKHSADQFERLLKEMCADEDEGLIIESAVKGIPKVFVVSTLVSCSVPSFSQFLAH